MKPPRLPRETQVISIRHPDLLDDAPSVMYYHGPDTTDSGSIRLKTLIEASGLPHLVFSHEKHARQATSHVKLALRCLAKNGHGIFDMHGIHERQHVVESGLAPSSRQVTSELFTWLSEKSTERLSGSPQRGTPVFHLLSCESGVLGKEMTPESPLWKEAYLMVYADEQATSETYYDCSIKTFLEYEKHCRDRGETMDPLKMFYLSGMRRGGQITLLGGDLKGPLTWAAPKTPFDLQVEPGLSGQIKGHPSDIERLESVAASVSAAEKALLPPVERAAVDIFHARLEREDKRNLMHMLRKQSKLASTPDAAGYLPLFIAVDNLSVDMVGLLKMYGADLSARNKCGESLLIRAVSTELTEGKETAAHELISYLLENGADPNDLDYQGRSALFHAIEAGRVDAVKLLLERGADPKIKSDGLTPLQLAKKKMNKKIIAALSAAALSPSANTAPETEINQALQSNQS